MKIEHLSGLIAAPFTAFHANGELNCEMIARQADSLVADGVKGAYICGTTGEGISCSVAERIAIMEAWTAASRGRLKLIAHTGALALGDVEVLGREAQRLGFYATSVVPPCYFKPGSVEALVEFCAAAAAAAPELPFYYYHTMNSGVNLSMVEFLEKADGRIPNQSLRVSELPLGLRRQIRCHLRRRRVLRRSAGGRCGVLHRQYLQLLRGTLYRRMARL